MNYPTSSLLCLSLQSCSAASHRSLDDHFLPVGVCAVCAWFSTNKHQLTPLRLLWQALTFRIHVSLSASLCIFQRVRADVILHFIFTAELLSLSKANEFWDRVFGPWIHLIYFFWIKLCVFTRDRASLTPKPQIQTAAHWPHYACWIDTWQERSEITTSNLI